MTRRWPDFRMPAPKPYTLMDYFWILLIASVMTALVVAAGAFSLLTARPAHATWKPQFGNSPPSVQQWFKDAAPPAMGAARLGINRCCEKAERLRTKFIGAGTDWAYYPDPSCTGPSCQILPIPADVIHEGVIHAENPDDDNLPEFQEMRREGVLFIWRNAPSCFWPPEPSI